MEEKLLLKRAAKGDKAAFGELIEPYLKGIYYLCLRMLKNESDAADAAQESLIKIYGAAGSFEARSSFSTWAYSVTKNTCLDAIRKSARPVERGEELDAERLAAGREFDPELCAIKGEESRRVAAAVAKLPEEMRAVIVLRYMDGYAYDDIARLLGISPGTVKSRLFRGREKLRTLLGD